MTQQVFATEDERGFRVLEELARQASTLRGVGVEGSARFGELTVRYAEEILRLARGVEFSSEVRARHALADLLKSPGSQLFSAALTDRIHRSSSADETVHILRELARRSDAGGDLPALDRVQLRAARMFGPVVPELVRSAILHRLRSEASPYLWDATSEVLGARIGEAHRSGYEVNLNHLGEEVFGIREARERLMTYIQLVGRTDVDAVSVKLSGIDSQIELTDFDATVARLESSVAEILQAATCSARWRSADLLRYGSLSRPAIDGSPAPSVAS